MAIGKNNDGDAIHKVYVGLPILRALFILPRLL